MRNQTDPLTSFVLIGNFVYRVRAISLDLIKRRLDKGLYKRLDTFQEDVFSCLDRARRLSRTDSQIFEDSIELQSFFIKKRDEMCKDQLTSPALSYSAMHLSASVEAVRQTKLLQEEQEQEQENEMTVSEKGSFHLAKTVHFCVYFSRLKAKA